MIFLRSRAPSSWTSARGARRRVGADLGGVRLRCPPCRLLWKKVQYSQKVARQGSAPMLLWVEFVCLASAIHELSPRDPLAVVSSLDQWSTIAIRFPPPTLALLPHSHVFPHSVVPSQLRSVDPHGPLPRLRCDLEGRQSWRRLGRALQPENCRKRVSAKRSKSRHSRCLAKRTLDHCAWVHLGNHCLQPPHGVEDCTVFTSFT